MIPTLCTSHRPGERRTKGEAGMSTAEYAVGAVGACTMAGVLLHLGGSDWFLDLVREVFSRALEPRLLIDLVHPGGAPRIEHGP